MSSAAPPRRPAAARPKKRHRPLLIAIGVVVALLILLVLAAQFWTEVLWFRQLGFAQVLYTEWGTRIGLFLGGFLLMAGVVFLCFSLAYRSRPIYAPSTPEQATLDQYREAVEPLRKVVMIAVPALVGFFAGVAAGGQWQKFLLATHSQHFGVKDPQFGIDLSFYVFTLPLMRFIVTFLMAVVIVSAIAAVATHYLYGGIRIGGPKGSQRMTKAARVQMSVIAAVFMLLVAANYWLDRYTLVNASGSKFDGASYADVHAVLPSKTILAIVAIFVAALFVVVAFRSDWKLPAIGVGLMVVSAIAIGGIYPAIVQRFQVAPNAQQLESKYIQRNIDATRDAYGIDGVETQDYAAKTTTKAGQLRSDADTTASIRLLDPQIVSPTFRQLQQIKQYYGFSDTLSVDRYTIDGENHDTVIAVRELDQSGLGAGQQNWVNQHTVYTHGYGVVAAYGNQIGPDGQPAFYESSIPSEGKFTQEGSGYEERIYFSTNAPTYSIVGAEKGSKPWELDRPASNEGGQVNNTFPTDKVSAGPKIDNFATKLLFAIKFGSEQIVFSDRVNSESQILYDRNPRERVQKVAPYLTLDGRVYPAVVDGRVKWIVDGYTTSNSYPYSTSRPLDETTTDSLTARSSTVSALEPENINYIRNSVKATVDAYDGSVELYTWDEGDPVLKAWTSIFPSTVKPMSDISSDLMSHIRYPEDLFKVQRALLASYHVTDASAYFSGQDFWNTPNDPTVSADATGGTTLQPPYYLTLQMPGQKDPSFSLTSTYIPGGAGGTNARNVLTGFLAVDADAGNTAGKKSGDYGKLRLLELPRNSTVPGPGQAQTNFNTDPTVAQQLNLLKQGDSTVVRGNLLTLPVGGGLLYVEPVYIQAKEGTTYPLLRKVLVSFGDKIGFDDTLEGALNQVFGGASGAETADGDGGDEDTKTPDEGTKTPDKGTTGGALDSQAQADLNKALTAANDAYQEGQDALAKGDFAAYGEAQDKLEKAIKDAQEAESKLEASAASSPSAKATPSAKETQKS